MSMKDLEEAFNLIDANKDKGYVSGNKSEELILHAEEILALKFPPTYRLFLKKYGCGGIGGTEIYGLTKNSAKGFTLPGGADGIWLTIEEREKRNLPHHFIIIESLGEGSQYYLDASQVNEDCEYPVVLMGIDLVEENKEIIAEDFGEFLLEQTKTSLDVFNECHSNE